MTTHHFFIRQSQIDADRLVKLDGPDARHIRLVLRLKKGSKIRLVDEEQNLHLASVEKVTARSVFARVLESTRTEPSRVRLRVVQGVPQLPKADLITQKLTELGARTIVFVPTEHTSYSDGFDRISGRLPRLRRIAEAAAKQCARPDIPDVLACAGLSEAAKSPEPGALLLVANEKARGGNLRDLLAGVGENPSVTVFIGPEGGLSSDETRLLEDMGAAGFSLGRNILRTETAAIAAAAIILYELGEI
jgi:16S rRNA (uracil1498-N3)-methyltransferase